MGKIHTIIKKGAGGGGGDSDLTISVGTFTGSIGDILGALATLSVGILTASLVFIANLIETVGTYTLSTFSLNDDTGSGTRSVGTQTDTFPTALTNVLSAQSVGTKTSSLSAGSSIVGTKYTGTATGVSNGGTVDWVNPTNAQGAFDDTNASITVSEASGTINDDLKLTAFNIPAITAGFTRTKLEILVRHRWDSTGQLLETCTFVVNVRKADDTLVSTVQTITEATASRAALATDTFDFTTAGAVLTDAEVQGLQVWCEADASLLSIVQGNFSWNVDGVHLIVSYARSGIT